MAQTYVSATNFLRHHLYCYHYRHHFKQKPFILFQINGWFPKTLPLILTLKFLYRFTSIFLLSLLNSLLAVILTLDLPNGHEMYIFGIEISLTNSFMSTMEPPNLVMNIYQSWSRFAIISFLKLQHWKVQSNPRVFALKEQKQRSRFS